jgi:hypothetical protein
VTPEDSSPVPHHRRLVKHVTRIGLGRMSVVEFLVALILLIIAAPFVEEMPAGDLIEAGLMTVVLVSAVLAVGQRGRVSILSLVLVVPPLAGKWALHFNTDTMPPAFYLVPLLAFLIFVVVQFVRFILRAPRVNTEVLCAGLSIYLLLGMLWAFAYTLVALLNPGAFTFTTSTAPHPPLHGFDAFYFSYITLTTVGYGDIVPVHNAARMLASTEAMTGTLFVAVFISRLVALYSASGPAAGASSQDTNGPADKRRAGE